MIGSIQEKERWDILLELNEKAVRKGKPLGLPYVGSKKKISKQIVQIIKDNFGTDDWYGVSFNSQEFYDWVYGMAKDNGVIISSYEISDERFKCVYSFDTVRSTMQGGNAGKKCEKLFMVSEF